MKSLTGFVCTDWRNTEYKVAARCGRGRPALARRLLAALSLALASSLSASLVLNLAYAQHAGHNQNASATNAAAAGHIVGHGTAIAPHSKAISNACKDTSLNCAKSATPAFAPDGSLWLVWSAGGAVSLSRSGDLGRTFEPPIEIAQHGSFLDVGADARPQIVINKAGNFAIAYAFFKDKQWNAQVNIVSSQDGGKSFSEAHPLVIDGASQRFPTLALTPQGQLFATWIDKRLVAAAKQRGDKKEGGSIAYAWSRDMGNSFQTERILHDHSCECCRLGVDLTPQGMPALVYRAIFDGTTRDHAVQIFTSEDKATEARPVSNDNWFTNSCPHHGPAIAVSHAGTLHTAWYTQGTNRVGAYYARSTDNGKHFATPRELGKIDSLSGRPYLLAKGETIWLVWKNFDGQQASVIMQKSLDDGATWSPPKEIARGSGHTDHPLLLEHDAKVYLSWLTSSEGYQLKALN